ncbi:MAG: helix-turn-helix domain-containing protein [Oscillospiraceae bacterium]|nr:helix-turn-helix domain-containing protein [Oscillospiraceae bacterium]
MKNLAALRKQKGLTQMQLAKLIGVSTSTVAMWETGQRKPDYHTIAKLRDFFAVGFEQLLGMVPVHRAPVENIPVPVVGQVRAGQPATARENIIGYEMVNEQLSRTGEIFALKIKGSSMEPKMSDGDVVIVRRQSTAENGQTAVVMVGREEATVKKVYISDDGITLLPTNPAYTPMHYSALECENLPVTIVGVVVELRCRYL